MLDFVQELRVGRKSTPREGSADEHDAVPGHTDDAYDLFQRGLSLIDERPLGAGRRAAREGQAPGARQDARSARRSAAPTSAAAATADAASEFSAVVERNPANDYAHFCLGRSFEKLGDRPRRQQAPVAGLPACARTATDYRLYRDRLKAA